MRWLPVLALAAAVVAAALMGGRLLLTPVEGDLLVLASGRQPDRLASSSSFIPRQDGRGLVPRPSGMYRRRRGP